MTNTSSHRRLSVVVATDVRVYRECLVSGLTQHRRWTVVGASTHVEVLSIVRDGSTHVVVVDIAMRDSLELIRDIRAQADTAKVLAFAVDDGGSDILDCAEAGAAGYVPPDASLDDLAHAIDRIAREELVCSPRVAARLFRRIAESGRRPSGEPRELKRLTTREAEVLGLMGRGYSNKEIAARLHVAESTVKNHVHHVLAKLKVTTRAQAIARTGAATPRRYAVHQAPVRRPDVPVLQHGPFGLDHASGQD
ncbi:MAG: response regulator transcription factor [Acidobacteriota bacterium]